MVKTKKKLSEIKKELPSKTRISSKDAWNLKMEIEGLKKKLLDLQNMTAELPDEYVENLCDSDNYPLEDAIDDDMELSSWCNEVDEFLKSDLDFQKPTKYY